MPSPITAHLPNGLATVEQEIARACKEARRDRASVTLIAVSKTFDADGDRARDRGRTARFRRKSRAGSQGEVARVNVGLPRPRAASDRAAAIQQGQGGGGAVRRHSFGRPPEHLRSVSQGNRFPETQRRNCSFSSTPARSRRRRASRPAEADAFIAGCRDKYGLRISGLMCIPPVDDAPAPHFALTAKIAARNGLEEFLDGHERRFCHRDPVRRHPCARRLGDFRSAVSEASRRAAPGFRGCTTRFALHRPRSQLTRSRFSCPAPAAPIAAASPISSSKRIPRSARNCRAPDAGRRRCRGRRCAASCCDRSRR